MLKHKCFSIPVCHFSPFSGTLHSGVMYSHSQTSTLFWILQFTVLAGIFVASNGSAYLRRRQPVSELISEDTVYGNMVSKIKDILASPEQFNQLVQLKAQLAPTFAALPKNQWGRLDQATIRYALHRIFVAKKGWYFKGLDGNLYEPNALSTKIVKDGVPMYVERLVEEELGEHGLGLAELTILGSVLEHLVHSDMESRLEAVLNALSFQKAKSFSEEEALGILEGYALSLLLNQSAIKSHSDVIKQGAAFSSEYAGWDDARLLIQDSLQNMKYKQTNILNPFVPWRPGVSTLIASTELFTHTYGQLQNQECSGLKTQLLTQEEGNSGRVRLSDFYRLSLSAESPFRFSETKEYLRRIGALDESNVRIPRIIIPNYVTSLSNCVSSTSFYSICCINECEGLLQHIENNLETPNAIPADVGQLVANLSSATVEAPRNLSKEVLGHLDEIAQQNDGKVPLHSRLFTQWMHHVFPRECPYPRSSVAQIALTPDEWMQQSGESIATTEEEMKRIVNISEVSETDVEVLIPWSAEEKLLLEPEQDSRIDISRAGWDVFRALLLLTGFISVVHSLLGAANHVFKTSSTDKLDKFV